MAYISHTTYQMKLNTLNVGLYMPQNFEKIDKECNRPTAYMYIDLDAMKNLKRMDQVEISNLPDTYLKR